MLGARVFVGIDELDKIGAPEQAERFLNEIKGIFGIPHLYFMVSVSDDALTSFERRGLPLRDAFDSSFDEIIQVGPLSYTESRRLLYRRVIGLTEPYVAFCHCLACGLARDLIRAARQGIGRVQRDVGRRQRARGGRAPRAGSTPISSSPSACCATRPRRQTSDPRHHLRRRRAGRRSAARRGPSPAPSISAAPGHGQELQDTLNQTLPRPGPRRLRAGPQHRRRRQPARGLRARFRCRSPPRFRRLRLLLRHPSGSIH